MALTIEESAKIKARLAMGSTPRELADGEFRGVAGYVTILNLRKELAAGKEREAAQTAASIDPVVLDIVIEKAREEAPVSVVKKMEKIQEGLSGLQILDDKFHTTMIKALERAEEYLEGEGLKSSEWVAITNALSSAYNNIFNSKGVSVNVNNGTQFSDSKLQMFKGSLRG